MTTPYDPNQSYPQQPYGQQPTPAAPVKKKRKWPWIVLAVIAVFAVIAVSTSGGSDDEKTAAPATSAAPVAEGGAVAAEPVDEAPEETRSQANAIKSGENYLSFAPFSRDGLIQQLTVGDGYSTEDATYAVDNIDADYNEQAAKAAENYLELTGFSRDGLVQQLTVGDGYTPEQAEFGADSAGL